MGGMYEATPDCRAFGGSRRNGSCRGKPARLAARQRCDRDRGRRSGSRRPVSGGGLTYFGDGVYKSTDGGKTWQHWGLVQSAAIGRIVVDPVDPQRVFVAAAGSISRIAGQRGIYRVTNGGKDWKLVLAPPNSTTGGIDLAIDPSNHNRIFAALWDHERNNGARVYGGSAPVSTARTTGATPGRGSRTWSG